MFNKPINTAFLCLFSAAVAAQAQNVFVLPGAAASGNSVQVLSSLFSQVGNVSVGNFPFTVIAKPDGSKYYAIGSSGSQTVTAFDSNFQNPQSLGNLGSQATAAAITPDGKKLLVVAGTLHVIDTSSDTDLTSNGVVPGTAFTDVAVSLDGTRAYLLGKQQNGQGVLYAIDLTSSSYTVAANFAFSNITTSVVVGPNGLVYVGAGNRVYELNPSSLTLTPAGEIQTSILAGKIAFTPDGKYALVAKQDANQTLPSVDLIDLNTHTVSVQSANIGNALITQLLVASPTVAYGFSSQTSGLYQFSIPGLAISSPSYSGVSGLGITGVGLSNDVAGGTHTSTGSLYVLSTGNAYKVDLASNTVSSPVSLTNPQSQAISVTGPFTSNSTTPITILTYGSNQAVAQSGTSGPLVARVLDANGNPIFGTTVTFSSGTTGVVIQNPTVTTGANGYAVTTITAPATSGPAVVTATAGSATANFNLTVGTSGGGGTPTGGVSIVAGQGQLVFQNNNTNIAGFGSPLLVKVTDPAGKPVANASVTFSIATGFASLFPGTAPDGTVYPGIPNAEGTGLIISSDANGLASVGFLSSTIQPFSGSSAATVTASASGTNSVTFFVTIVTQTFPPTALFQAPQLGTILSGSAGSTLKGAVQVAVVDGFGKAIPNVSVRLVDPSTSAGDPSRAPNSTSVACADTTGNGVLTDATGTATCDVVLIGKVGSAQFQTDVGYHYLQGPYTVNLTPGAPAAIQVLSGDKQTGKPGQQLPAALVATVTDAGGNLLSGAPVTFKVVTAGTGTLSSATSNTDQNGRASTLLTLGTTPGSFQVTATAAAASVTFNYTVAIPAASIQAVSGGGQTAVLSAAFAQPLVVKLLDSASAAVAGIPVAFAVTTGSATVGSATATTDATGQASTTVTAGTGAGPITITATGAGLSTTFSLTAAPPGPNNVTFVNGASFQPGISPGSIAIIQGVGLLPGVTGLVKPTGPVGPLPTSLSGFGVTFNGTAAPIFYVSNQSGVEQVAIQVPFEVTPGNANVVITAAGGVTGTVTVPVLTVAPGLFTTQYSGQPYAVVVRPDGSYVSPTNPAIRGEVDCTFATGLGQVTPTIATNSAGIANQNVMDSIAFGLNNAGVRVVSATTAPGSVGVYQVCFEVPSTATPGSYQPVGLIVHDNGNDVYAQSTYIPIQ